MGRLAYRMKTRWRDGTTHVLMERHELLDRLAPLIPPPRAHQVRYHGLLAPCSSGRDRVVPQPLGFAEAEAVALAAVAGGRPGPREEANRGECADEAARLSAESLQRPVGDDRSPPHGLRPDWATTSAAGAEAKPRGGDTRSTASTRRTRWADLLQRVFEADALCCPRCGGRMRVLAAITEADVARRILASLNLPTRAPPLTRSRPGGRALARPAHEPVGAGQTDAIGSAFDFEFDQTTPAGWDVGA